MFHVTDEINPRWGDDRAKWSTERMGPALAFSGVSGDSGGIGCDPHGRRGRRGDREVPLLHSSRLLSWFSWADVVEEEERREEAKKEYERRARKGVEKERVEREAIVEAQAARELADRQRAEG